MDVQPQSAQRPGISEDDVFFEYGRHLVYDDDNFNSRLNGSYYLKVNNGQTVFDDNAKDYLYGGAATIVLTNNDGDGGS
jgi:hypothetical protein